jgi:hypothetical protein
LPAWWGFFHKISRKLGGSRLVECQKTCQQSQKWEKFADLFDKWQFATYNVAVVRGRVPHCCMSSVRAKKYDGTKLYRNDFIMLKGILEGLVKARNTLMFTRINNIVNHNYNVEKGGH